MTEFAEPVVTEPGSGRAAVASRKPTALWRGLIPSAPLLVALLAFARALAQPHALLNDPDTYLHIAAGNWIVAHRALPLADPFSFSLPGAPWTPGEWLGEVVLASAYRLGGWSGTVLLTAGCFAAAAGILAGFLGRRLGALPGTVAALAGASLILPHLLARPHVLVLPLLVGWSGLLLRARDEGRGPPWSVLPLMVLWANFHGSFLFGAALAGFLAVEAAAMPAPGRSRGMEVRAWGGFLLAAGGLGLLTPNGVSGIVQPLLLMRMPALHGSFGEWAPANIAGFAALEVWLLGLVVLPFVVRVRLSWTRLILLLGLIHMALQHVRHADLLGLVGPLAVAAGFGPALAARLLHGSRLFGDGSIFAQPARWPGLALTALLAIAAASPLLARPLSRADDAVTPAAAVVAASRLGLHGPVLNSESFGGYLVFSRVPDFIDGRVEMYGNDFLAADVAAEGGSEPALTRLLAQYRIRWTLLPPQAGAVAVLDRLPGWRRAYADAVAVIHVRVESAGH